ncbi:alpha/beta hydrolase [Vibrio chagasii]|nr:alpha/beta hydrolase [Vibrio chagasii]
MAWSLKGPGLLAENSKTSVPILAVYRRGSVCLWMSLDFHCSDYGKAKKIKSKSITHKVMSNPSNCE